MKGEPISAAVVFGLVTGVSAAAAMNLMRQKPEKEEKTFVERFGTDFKEKEIGR